MTVKKKLPENLKIRIADGADAARLSAIYNYYVVNSSATFATVPESQEERLAWLREHDKADLPVLVAVMDDQVLGFASLSYYHQRCAYRQTVEASVYLDNAYHSRGLGRRMLEELLVLAESKGFHAVLALICSENLPSLQLFEKSGFLEAGRLREVGRKFGRWLDVTILEKLLEN